MASSTLTATDFEHFGQKLYSTVSQTQNGQNVFLSPASIALAMSMCTVGAREKTLQQMLNTLEASTTDELTRTAEQVMRIFSIADQDKQVQLKLANRLYAQKAYELQQDYLKIVQGSFQADIKLEDFQKESTKAVQTINAWVEEQTNKLIQNLLSPNDVTSDTRLIIINCIYFKVDFIFNQSEMISFNRWNNRAHGTNSFPNIRLIKTRNFMKRMGRLPKSNSCTKKQNILMLKTKI